MLDTFLFNDRAAGNASGITTAQNAAVTTSSAAMTIGNGGHILIGVGPQPIHIRFGQAGTAAVATSNGFRLPAEWVGVLSVPEGANTLFHIRTVATDSTISVQRGNVGT